MSTCRPTFFSLLILTLIATSIYAKINIWKPDYLVKQLKDKVIETSVSSFGHVPYGHSIIGKLVLANPINGCKPMTFQNYDHHKEGALMVLTKRGDCPFAEKVYNAQKAGASLVIFIDNKPEDVKHVLPHDSPEYSHKISIPSVLVDSNTGAQFQKTLENIERNAIVNDKKNIRDKLILSVDFEANVDYLAKILYLFSVDHY